MSEAIPWPDQGYALLEGGPDGYLAVSDAFLIGLLERPELAPIGDSCAAERDLHADLCRNPRQPVGEDRLDRLRDPDAVDNYRAFLAFRDHLLAHPTIEGAYLALFTGRESSNHPMPVAPVFIDLLAQMIMRHILWGCGDPFMIRAGELFFREQMVTIREGAILLGDRETVERLAADPGMGNLGRLVQQSGVRARPVELTVLNPDNADGFFSRPAFHMVLDLSHGREGLKALCRVMEAWIEHFHGIGTSITPLRELIDQALDWYLGLDYAATALLNNLYRGGAVTPAMRNGLLSLFSLTFDDHRNALAQLQGRPVFMALSKDDRNRLRLKGQNLLVNLPLAHEAGRDVLN